jgi:inositol phosphorylceramide mannosyltransferase catalytic subunit
MYLISEYMLWTDIGSREFIAEHYPWFLDTFDNYTYPIQRADAIRYFILYHYGGVYLDLDVGCLRPLDPLLIFPVILPKTIPVGISNDLMFAEKGHPFLAQTIHNLVTFDHSWILNYPTVMFSTGPMFLSAQYGLYTASHPESAALQLRVLPKSMYGKNAKPGEAPHSFFSHFYGSSWHADDAAFIGFLGKWGNGLMWVGLVVLVIALGRLVLSGNRRRKYSLRRISVYEVLLRKWTLQNGRWYTHLGWFTIPGIISQPATPVPGSPIDEHVPFLPFDGRSPSPAPSDVSIATDTTLDGRPSYSVFDAFRRASHRAITSLGGSWDSIETPRRRGRNGGSRVLFFLPEIFTQSQDSEVPESHPLDRTPFQRTVSRPSQLPPEKQQSEDIEHAGLW